ncbi:hypothetical protein L2D14_15500 [Thalassospiraceae bacterium LMO-JJ14]|nr:hypothetical protein L2D14_15500 [Thalassospiraceae bacterium LMO-JJ14]
MKKGYKLPGISLLVLGLVLYILDQTLAPKYIAEYAAGSKEITPAIINFIFGELGVGAIVIVSVCLGGAYLVFGDLVSSLLSEKISDSIDSITKSVDDGFKNMSDTLLTGVVNLETDIILSWIRHGKATLEDYKEIGILSLAKHYGDHAEGVGGYLDYVTTQFLDKSMPKESVYRQGYRATVNIKKIPVSAYTRWSEVKRYELVTHGVGIKHNVKSLSIFPCEKDNLLEEMNNLDIKLEIEGEDPILVNKENQKDIIQKIISKNKYKSEDGCVFAYYEKPFLKIAIEKEIILNKMNTKISITEESVLSPEDNSYILSLPEPVKSFNFNFSSSEDYVIETVSVGPSRYYRNADENVDIKGWPGNERMVSIDIEKWVLPGIALTLLWRDSPDPQAPENKRA